jgi:FdhD protein
MPMHQVARQAHFTLIGLARGKRFIAVPGRTERIVFYQSLEYVPEESQCHRRKPAVDDA